MQVTPKIAATNLSKYDPDFSKDAEARYASTPVEAHDNNELAFFIEGASALLPPVGALIGIGDGVRALWNGHSHTAAKRFGLALVAVGAGAVFFSGADVLIASAVIANMIVQMGAALNDTGDAQPYRKALPRGNQSKGLVSSDDVL